MVGWKACVVGHGTMVSRCSVQKKKSSQLSKKSFAVNDVVRTGKTSGSYSFASVQRRPVPQLFPSDRLLLRVLHHLRLCFDRQVFPLLRVKVLLYNHVCSGRFDFAVVGFV